ncbi:MAG: hypothetical protein K0U74_12005 [Alphaproteobacteria bacterium]|nr:hypothetical protein [Alphaproteobacteria bacterium]
MSEVTLNLNSRPDGYGFLYGDVWRGDEHHRVNVLPPAGRWAGDLKLEDYEPHATDWVVYMDGEEVARAKERDGLLAVIQQHLLEG